MRKALSDGGDRKGEHIDVTKKSSTPRDVEPNERPEAATPIKLTEELRSILGKLDRSDDVDWFALSHDATEPWLLEVIVEPKAADLDLAIELEIDGQSSGALYNLGGPDAQESIPVLAIEQAAVRLAIRARAGSGDYAVRFKRRLTGGSIEAEPNDVASQAWPFSAPGEIQGVYDRPGDRDVFAVKLPELAPVVAKEGQLPDDARGVYTVQVSGIDGSPQVVELMTSPDQRVPWATLYVPAGAAAELPNVRPPEGVTMIWAALSGGQGATREQAYRLKWLPYPPLPKGQRLESEPNDEPAAAMSLSPVDALVQGYIHHPKDRDVYTLQLAQVQPAPDEQPSDKDLSGVPKKDEKVIDLFDTNKPKPTLTEEQEAQLAEVVKDAQPIEEHPDRPPKLVMAAWPTKQAPAFMVDLLVKPLKEELLPQLSWLDGPGRGTTAMSTPLGGSSGAKATVAALCAQPLEAQPVTFAVEAKSASADLEGAPARKPGPDYQLHVRVRKPAADEELEPNDDRAGADALALAQTGSLKGIIAREGDVDYFMIDLSEAPKAPDSAGQWLHHVTIELENHPLNLQLMIYDQDGIALTGPEGVNKAGPGGRERFVADWPQGRYFIAVAATSGSLCEPYSLKVNLGVGAP